MIIINQDKDMAVNFNTARTIETDGNKIRVVFNREVTKPLSDEIVGEYKSPERTAEVFGQILKAVVKNEKVFEMPEE